MIYNDIIETIGKTPIVRINKMGPKDQNIFVKCEAFNPLASVKDRLAIAIISDAEESGKLSPGQTVVEATSGNTGIALAMVCAARGYPFVATMVETFSIERRKIMKALGAKVILTPAEKRGTGMVNRAKELAENADVIIAVGTRLQDFTTGSWTTFRYDAKFININTARFDAKKHFSNPIVGDALECLNELNSRMEDWVCDTNRIEEARKLYANWNEMIDKGQAPTNESVPSYAQVIAVVNKHAKPQDTMVTAAGGLPGETIKNWRVKAPNTFDCEFGFSCMGYEIAGAWGHAMAKNGEGVPIVMVGDGSYMMMNSDIYSSVLSGHKMIVIVCDNGGFAVINRLQTGLGVPGFNNLLKDARIKNKDNPPHVDFAKHAEAMGALARHCESLSDLENAMDWAQTTDRTTVISINSDAYSWTPGGADWYVGVPEINDRQSIRDAREGQEAFRKKQRQGI